MLVEKRFIKEKAVATVIQIAACDWPERWPKFLDLLVTIAGQGVRSLPLIMSSLSSSGVRASLIPPCLTVLISELQDTQLELILITLRDLVEEIRVYNDRLDDKRRRAMNVSLTASLPDIMAFFKKFIELQYQLYIQTRTSPLEHAVASVCGWLVAFLPNHRLT
jgi:hypothetical protein